MTKSWKKSEHQLYDANIMPISVKWDFFQWELSFKVGMAMKNNYGS